MSSGQVSYRGKPRVIPRDVWYNGSDAVKKGTGLCYNTDYGTATASDGHRTNDVEKPSTSNYMAFAGVAAINYDAVTGGQLITIFEPGSTCEVLIGVDTVIDQTILTCSCSGADAGRFTDEGFVGRGTAIARETNASGNLAKDTDGSATLDATGLIVTNSGETFVTKGVAAGDKFVLMAGEKDGTNAVTPGEYTLASVDSETQVTLTAAASDGGTMQCNYYIYSGTTEPYALCYLYDGNESGLQEWISPESAAAAECTDMGFSRIFGAVTLATASTGTVGTTGVPYGAFKGFLCFGTLTTAGYTVSAAGTKADGSTASTTFTFDAALEASVHVRGPHGWGTIVALGVTQN